MNAPKLPQTLSPKPKPCIEGIVPYIPGAPSLPDGVTPVRLSSNESALGPSPRALEAARDAAGTLSRYPDGSARALRQAIADTYGLDPSRIICGNGSDELLALIAMAYLDLGDEAVITAHTFSVYETAVRMTGARLRVVPDPDLRISVDAILKRVTPRTKIVFLANPNNPTGTYLSYDEVRRLQMGLPRGTLLVIDSAYAEYVAATDYDAGAGLVDTASNVIMTRTFSKIFGLASLRLGWAYCPADVMRVLNKIRGPYNLNGVAQAAGLAALEDTAHTAKALKHNERWLGKLTEAYTAMGLEPVPSAANFILVRFPGGAGASAAAAERALHQSGIIVRHAASFGLPDCLRISVGDAKSNKALIEALVDHLTGQSWRQPVRRNATDDRSGHLGTDSQSSA